MINNMLGEYSKFIQIQDDGTVKVFVPEDVNNPSMENATELTLSKNEAISLMGLVTQPKQYEVLILQTIAESYLKKILILT